MREEFWVSQCEHCRGLEASMGADVSGVAGKSKLGPMPPLHSDIVGFLQGFGSTMNPQFSLWKSMQPASNRCLPLCNSCLHAQGFHGSKVTLQLPRTKNSSHHTFSTPSPLTLHQVSQVIRWRNPFLLHFFSLQSRYVQIACALWKLQPKPWVDAMGQTCHSLMSTHVDSCVDPCRLTSWELFKHLGHLGSYWEVSIYVRRIGWGRLWAGLVATHFESQRKAGPAASSAAAMLDIHDVL